TYAINALYLAVFFGAFAWYRRFVLAEYEIKYLNYGSAIIEALVLAKVVWFGEVIGLVRDRGNRPLLYPTIQKAFVFTVFFGVFAIIEHMVGGMIEGIGASGGMLKLWHEGMYELLARCMVTFCALIPFFAFRELARTFGEGKLWKLFFRRREENPPEIGLPA
ncbi:MAG: hypothetical protein ACXWC8_17835, partial [Limisphaerales bacterium]